jgi:hypothetical protein
MFGQINCMKKRNVMPFGTTVAGRRMSGDERRAILAAFDTYASELLEAGKTPTVKQFHELHGEDLCFARRSLLRWIEIRRTRGVAALDERPYRHGRLSYFTAHPEVGAAAIEIVNRKPLARLDDVLASLRAQFPRVTKTLSLPKLQRLLIAATQDGSVDPLRKAKARYSQTAP